MTPEQYKRHWNALFLASGKNDMCAFWRLYADWLEAQGVESNERRTIVMMARMTANVLEVKR